MQHDGWCRAGLVLRGELADDGRHLVALAVGEPAVGRRRNVDDPVDDRRPALADHRAARLHDHVVREPRPRGRGARAAVEPHGHRPALEQVDAVAAVAQEVER